MTARTRTATPARRALAATPSARLAAGIAATTAIGAIALTAAAPWASAATPAPAARAELTSFTGPAQPKHATTATPATTAKHATTAKPATIYDSVTPSSIPSGADAAVYADGTYQASTAAVAGHKHVLWIDTNGSRPDANALDVEPGDATPAGAATWAHAKLTSDPGATAIIYTFTSDWAPAIAAISALPASMQAHVKYWIADPTGTPHILPGAAATQWHWGASYDITAAQPGFIS